MGKGLTKAERLREMERLYFQRPYSDIEMAERLGVDRTTVFRDRRDLSLETPIIKDKRGRWRIDKTRYLSSIRVNLHEALTLYLAARRASQQTRTAQLHAANALEKLALALRQPMTKKLVKAADQILAQKKDPELVRVFEIVAQAWVEGLKVRITYQGLRSKRSYNFIVAPYLIEPSPWSESTYLIGHSDVHGEIATFKIERIEQASLTTEKFQTPEDFDENDLLRHAWGIWSSEQEPEPVRLKFAPGVAARRLKESVWHPLEEITDTEDGGCIWEAPIAEWQEMLPWIRGWGADVEVVAPEGLRANLIRESRKMVEQYDFEKVSLPLYQRLWAKTYEHTEETHPLIYHLTDVAQTALAMWEYALAPGIKQWVAGVLDLDVKSSGRLLAFWAGLHDLGKASPCFQRKHEATRRTLETELKFPMVREKETCQHGTITTITLQDLLIKKSNLPDDWAFNISTSIGGHHGSWPSSNKVSMHEDSRKRGEDDWEQVRCNLFTTLQEILDPPLFSPPDLDTETCNAFFAFLSGLTSVADWLGSIEDYFGPHLETSDLPGYAHRSARKAKLTLEEQGWIGWSPPAEMISFRELFNGKVPRPLQKAIIKLAPKLDRPSLVVIEAPTGVGKTEAALYLADHWARALDQSGMYVAMPTMATSNQMYDRVKEVITRRNQDKRVTYLLLHGNALLEDNDKVPRLAKIEGDGEKGTVAALSWFVEKSRRGLLAPIAVGTVDQSLLSILQTPHFFVRLFGLSHKTVIFDEVHAYDTYMDELFERLLGWLRIMHTPIVVLSATLPAETRQKMVEAYLGKSVAMPKVRYPAITYTADGQPEVIPLARTQGNLVRVEKIPRAPEQIAQKLKEYLKNGGCAAVICNTVGRAQKVFEAIRDKKIVPDRDLILLHARLPYEERMKMEGRVLKSFGKPDKKEVERPQKSIVVATQVIEQSLDLDFDVMITDLAPVDMIIQRVGRLHRHKQQAPRPEELQNPILLLTIPDEQDGQPIFDQGDEYIYSRYLLLRSWLAMRDKDSLTLPTETQKLIEAVYGPEQDIPEMFREALQTTRKKMAKKQKYARREAKMKCVPEHDTEDLLEEPNAELEEDNPELHKYRRAATRLAPPSVTLICLSERDEKLFLRPAPDKTPVNLKEKPDFEATRSLLNRKIDVTNYYLVKHFSEQEVPEGWRKNAWLRHARHVPFVPLSERGVYSPKEEPWRLILDPKLGLIFEKKEDDK